jgi:hypothetical protein
MSTVADGKILLAGIPTFLLGFYYETRERTTPQLIELLDKLGASGFNALHSNPRRGEAEFRELLQRAHDQGIHVIGEDVPFLENLEKYADQPALLGWSVSDDAGDHATPEEIAAHHLTLQKRFPNHLTYLSISGWSKKLAENAWPADLIGVQCYPVDYPFENATPGMPNPLYEAYHIFHQAAREALWHGKPAIANIQAFDWGTGRSVTGKQGPTPLEVRNMAWQAVVAGVKGVLFYSYDTGATGVRHDPALWDACAQFARELRPLSQVLAQYRPTVLTTQERGVVAVRWVTERFVDTIAINTSKWEKKSLSLSLAAKFEGKTENFLGKLTRVEDDLKGELSPLEVAHVRVVR